MNVSYCLLLLSAAWGAAPQEVNSYDDYRTAYLAAQAEKRPLLVILNPPGESKQRRIDLSVLQKSRHRRELLGHYVVVHVDTGTPDGKLIHKMYKSPPLPRIVVQDKTQKFKIYQTSERLSPEQWNLILEQYWRGDVPAEMTTASY